MGNLDTGIKLARNVSRYSIGGGCIDTVAQLVDSKRGSSGVAIYFIDEFFEHRKETLDKLGVKAADRLFFISTSDEPSTQGIDSLVSEISSINEISAVIGMGGGIVMDTAKAVSNLLTNKGSAADFQGWDLLTNPGVFKIAIPTISGTGAEATRTCVMTNKATGLKLGMNSDFTVYDHVIMDHHLTSTVPRNQYFFTGMDAYIHCMESLAGEYRNAIGDAYSRETMNLCRQVFSHDDMQTALNREKLMVASYMGGCAIATSYVGVVHPFSAGLSVVLGIHHCLANCIVMRAMEEFYPTQYQEFWNMANQQDVDIPVGLASNLTDQQYQQLFESTIIHEKPLINALGENFRAHLTEERVKKIFKAM